MSIKITGLQLAQDALRKELEKLQGGGYVLVGIHEDAGAIPNGKISTATLGAIQHYGNEDIPARPWLDVGVEQGNKEYLEMIEEGVAAGKSQQQILADIGNAAVGYAQQYIRDLKEPPNAPSTIKQKGSDNPLYDTGHMSGSVKFKIANVKPEEGL